MKAPKEKPQPVVIVEPLPEVKPLTDLLGMIHYCKCRQSLTITIKFFNNILFICVKTRKIYWKTWL
jgi:hypothetical protein